MGNRKILVVDDDASIRKLLRIRLEAHHYQIYEAEDGRKGLEMILGEKPDLVILDVLMPGGSGFQLVDEVRDLSNEMKDVPIIVLTGKESMIKIFDPYKVSCFIRKPYDFDDMLKRIESAMSRQYGDVVEVSQGNAGTEQRVGQHVVLVGVNEYILGKVKGYLESLGFSVDCLFNEEDAIKQVKRRVPQYVISQYWEEPEKFDAKKIYLQLQENDKTKQTPFFAFCAGNVGMEAVKSIPSDHVITYTESKDLIDSLDKRMKQ